MHGKALLVAKIKKITTFTEFSDYRASLRAFPDFVKADYIWMVLDRSELRLMNGLLFLTSSRSISTSLLNTRTSFSLPLRMALTAYSLPKCHSVSISPLLLTILLIPNPINYSETAFTDSGFVIVSVCDIALNRRDEEFALD